MYGNRIINILIFVFVSQQFLFAQQINTLYFIENSTVQHFYNPAFQPKTNSYFSLPLLGHCSFDAGNNAVKLNDLLYDPVDLNNNFVNQGKGLYELKNLLQQNTVLYSGFSMNLVSFGFKQSTSFWNFTINERLTGIVSLPKDIVHLILIDSPETIAESYDFTTLQSDFSLYTEAALGYSKLLNDKWSVGIKMKLLLGHLNLSNTNDNITIQTGVQNWQINANGSVDVSNLVQLEVGNSYQTLSSSFLQNVSEFFKPAGVGAGVDFGFKYHLNQNFDVSGSILDFGFIRWSKDAVNYNYPLNYIGALNFNDAANNINLTDTYNEFINNNPVLVDTFTMVVNRAGTTNKTNNAYFSSTSTKFNLALEYNFPKRKFGVGLLWKSQLYKNILISDGTLAFNMRPTEWLNASLSYTFQNAFNSTFGLGLGLNLGFVNVFVATDYIATQTLSFTPSDYSTILPNKVVSVPYNSNKMNFSMGINLVFNSSSPELLRLKKSKQNQQKPYLNSNNRSVFNSSKGLHTRKKVQDCRCE